jgi:hypothetical protein
MVEPAAVRAEVEAAAVTDVARAAAVELEALCGSSITSSVSADSGTDDELKLTREAAREQAAQLAVVHPQGRGGESPDRRGRADDAPGGGARGGRAPNGGGSPDRHRHTGG